MSDVPGPKPDPIPPTPYAGDRCPTCNKIDYKLIRPENTAYWQCQNCPPTLDYSHGKLLQSYNAWVIKDGTARPELAKIVGTMLAGIRARNHQIQTLEAQIEELENPPYIKEIKERHRQHEINDHNGLTCYTPITCAIDKQEASK